MDTSDEEDALTAIISRLDAQKTKKTCFSKEKVNVDSSVTSNEKEPGCILGVSIIQFQTWTINCEQCSQRHL